MSIEHGILSGTTIGLLVFGVIPITISTVYGWLPISKPEPPIFLGTHHANIHFWSSQRSDDAHHSR